MVTYIYDIEVYPYDWFVGFKRPEPGSNSIIIHNDISRLRAFLTQPDIIIGGFNNKHYDDYVVKTMINGGTNYHVKKHNDHIIAGNEPWGYSPFDYDDMIFKRLPCSSFDLRDDIPDPGISLKAIEGNLRRKIVECEIPFDWDKPLTKEQIKKVIKYLNEDLDGTIALYWERKENYLDAKVLVGEMYGVPVEEALGLTNAKLSARVLGAKAVKRNDERDYIIPDNIDTNLISKKILDFFMQIRDKSIPDAKLFGAGKGSKGMTLDIILKTSYGECPVTYAWGGVHGAKPCVVVEETEDRVIINQDVGSLYPNSMINFGYCSRSMADPEAYQKLVLKRLGYKDEAKKYSKKIVKKLGDGWYKKYDSEDLSWKANLGAIRKDVDEETFNDIKLYIEYDAKQSSLKLVINTVYGAMLNLFNDLADRWAGRSVCISNQLAMTMLITMLCKQCETIDFVNINTDGIMFTIDKSEVELSEIIVASWCEITKFEMERDDFKKVIQKDVNNYIGITPDGKFKTKGGYVSLYEGGNFKTNSLSIIHKAVVDFLVKGIPAETTINECKDIFAFQQIVKTGGTYEGSYHYVNGEREPIQKVNRVYAVKDPKYGAVVKGKWITEKRKKNKDTGKMESTPVDPPVWSETVISECPDHAFIDNENVLTVDDLDKDYYIDMAKKRIDKYINIDSKVENKINKIKEVIEIMADKKETNVTVTDEATKAIRGLNVYGKLAVAREKFLEAPVKKSGVNRFAEYKYFELEDIVPVATSIFADLGLLFIISFDNDIAKGTLVNVDKPEETIVFTSPMRELEVKGMNAVQALGGTETYQRRYLYMVCLDIVEADAFDATNGKPDPGTGKAETSKKSSKPATTEERQEVKEDLINKGGEATDVQIKAIKNGLKKLRAKNDSYEGYVGECVKKIKAGLNKTEAENLMIEIGKKVAE